MIDIHNHILPNIDDGPTNETEMLDLLKQATTQGVTEIIVTSHHLHPRYTTPIEKVKSCLNHIESLEEVQALNLKFYYGQEIRITDQILNDIDRKVITGINDSRYLLINFHQMKFHTILINYFSNYKVKALYRLLHIQSGIKQ